MITAFISINNLIKKKKEISFSKYLIEFFLLDRNEYQRSNNHQMFSLFQENQHDPHEINQKLQQYKQLYHQAKR